ncbi:branched-chain amino acid ABC transporter permease [Jatrophihabitans endophyticus]|uniref:branched-chain amino acid ABC transporter permease n=1 Tax=Jatrophihabitans endophyticus TaxID=1206085 RepID=UPI0026ECAE5B|nr:branched-chain amino acid ABC transporter permease [Jatrophihabitans endophyticus]
MHHQNWLQQLPENLLLGLQQGSLYALVALGYTLVYGVLQLINFAHSEVFMTGAFGSYIVVNAIIGNRHLTGAALPLTLIVGLLAGAVCGAAIAWLLEKVAYKTLRVRGAPKLAFLISAIGASLFLSNLAGKLFTRVQDNAFPGTVPGSKTYFNLSKNLIDTTYFKLSIQALIIILVALLMMLLLDRLVNRTKLGRAIRAVAEDAPTAALMGIDIDRTISRTFVIGGALAGVAGFMFGVANGGVFYTMGFTPGVKAFAAAVLGGIGNIRGAMLGGLLLGEAEILVSAVPHVGPQWQDVVSFVALILVLVFRPSGLLGERLGRAA